MDSRYEATALKNKTQFPGQEKKKAVSGLSDYFHFQHLCMLDDLPGLINFLMEFLIMTVSSDVAK